MKIQYDQSLIPSFYLWLEDTLITYGEAYVQENQNFLYADSTDIPNGYYSYFSSDRQFVGMGEDVPNYVSISGSQVSQNITGTTKLIIDYNKGRVLVSENVGKTATITGDFKRKEINTYLTTETHEDFIVNSEFTVSGDPYLNVVSEMGTRRYTLPAVFIANDTSTNEPFAMGGLDKTNHRINVTIMSDSLYDVESVSALFRDSARRAFKQIPYVSFPYGRWGTLKTHPYTYTGLIAASGTNGVEVERVNVYRFSDSAKSKLPKDLHIRVAEFDVSNVRNPRSQFL